MVRISRLWSGSGLFWEKWSGNGPDLVSKSGFWALGVENYQFDVTLAFDDDKSAPLTSIFLWLLAQSSVTLAFNISNLENRRVCWYGQSWIIYQSPDLVRILWGSLEKGKFWSGFSLVFFKFWSGFSLDLQLWSPEYKVEALAKVCCTPILTVRAVNAALQIQSATLLVYYCAPLTVNK